MKKLLIIYLVSLLTIGCKTVEFDKMGAEQERVSEVDSLEKEVKANEQEIQEYLIEEMQGNGFTDDEIDYAVSKLEAKYN